MRATAHGDSRARRAAWHRRRRATAQARSRPARRHPPAPGRRRWRWCGRGEGRSPGNVRSASRVPARPLGDLAAAFGWRRQDEIGGRDDRHLDMQVDPIHQRAGQPRLIVGGAAQVRPALQVKPAPTRGRSGKIHRGDQHEARRIGDAVVRARDRDLAELQRLAQQIERARIELRNSSRKSTPLCASDTSPGRARKPPPTSAGIEAE